MTHLHYCKLILYNLPSTICIRKCFMQPQIWHIMELRYESAVVIQLSVATENIFIPFLVFITLTSCTNILHIASRIQFYNRKKKHKKILSCQDAVWQLRPQYYPRKINIWTHSQNPKKRPISTGFICFYSTFSVASNHRLIYSPDNRPAMLKFDVFLGVSLNKLWNNQPSCQWFETPWCSFDVNVINNMKYHE